MVLSDLSIRRPVLATVMSLMLVLLGYLSFERLPVREYPNIDTPVVSVRTVYPGASAEIIESQVTRPLEDSLAGIEGIDVMKSTSREQVSNITIEFRIERDPDAAAADVRDRVSRARDRLPDEVDEPVISKVEADANAIIWLAFYSDRHSPLEITDFADRFVQDRLQTVPGVASVIIGGERIYAMRLWLETRRLAAHGVTVQDVEQALRRRNIEIPGGRIESAEREFTVLSETDLRTPEQFNDLIIREVDGYPVRLRDVGRAVLGAADDRKNVRVNGNPAVGLGIVKQSTANTLAVAQGIKAEIPAIRDSLPEGMKLEMGFDSSVFIEKSIKEVFFTLWEALFLVLAVTFVFLRTVRATFIPFVTIPVSLIGAFIFINALDFSVNVLTLLGLVLAIGLVVDDAIVMLENIHRRIEQGMDPEVASYQGSREIAFAIIAMTLTLATVFAPLGFMTGDTGRLFREFALAVSSAVLVSGFVALTLTPMMCSKILREDRAHGWLYNSIGAVIDRLIQAYRRALHWLLNWKWPVRLFGILSLAIFVAAVIVQLLGQLPKELSPVEDRGNVLVVITAPEGASYEYTDRYVRETESILAAVPEVETFFTVVAPGFGGPAPVNFAIGFISLQPWEERERSQQQIVGSLFPQLFGMPGVQAFPINPPSLGQGFRSQPISFVVQGPTYDALADYSDTLLDRIRENPGFINVDTDLRMNKPQLRVSVDRDRAADLGVEIEDIGRTMETLLGGRQVTRFKRQGEQYDVIVQVEDAQRNTPQDIYSLYVRGSGGGLIPLASLVNMEEGTAFKELNHFNRLRSVRITADLAPGLALGDALDFLEGVVRDDLPPVAKSALDGESREFRESSASLAALFVLALAFIYLVLAAQFESFVDPFIILLTVPLGMTGALAALALTGGTFNVYSQIGLVMLIGLITKNGILIVEFANQLRDNGRDLREAVIEAASLRLRPILMTTFAMVLGAVPLALSTGAGAESRSQIGWVIVGGLLLGTLLTLFVIPTVYSLMARTRRQPARSHEAAMGIAD